MTEPTELEKKIADKIVGLEQTYGEAARDHDPVGDTILACQIDVLRSMLREATERRLRIEYLGQSSITGGREERID